MRVAYDLDGVHFNFAKAFLEKAQEMGLGKYFPAHWTLIREWNFGGEYFSKVWKEIANDDYFWKSLEPFDDFFTEIRPCVYVTHRPCSSSVSAETLRTNGFPLAPVITTGESKVEALKAHKIDFFVEDKIENFREANEAGILTVLLSRPHNLHENTRITLTSGYEVDLRIPYMSEVGLNYGYWETLIRDHVRPT